MRRIACLVVFTLSFTVLAHAQSGFPPAEKWVVSSDNARVEQFQGKEAIRLRAGVIYRTDVEFENGTIEFDYLTDGTRSFAGIIFRIQSDSNFEEIYFRPHKFGQWDALQYEPVFNRGTTWQLHPHYNFKVDFPFNKWVHIRVEVAGSRAELYLGDDSEPVAVVDELQRDPGAGYVGFRVSTPADIPAKQLTANFANLTIRASNEPVEYRERRPPSAEKGFLSRWKISEAYAGPTGRETELPSKETAESWEWQEVIADSTGIVNLSRYLGGVTREANTTVATVEIISDRDQVKKLDFSYSDIVGVYLNSTLLFTGNNAYSSKYERYLGGLNVEQDSLYIPLKKGSNRLTFVLREIFGGWGFVCRIEEQSGIKIP